MPKSFRIDLLGSPKFQGEIGKSKSGPAPERVRCPIEGCECAYEMFGSLPANRAGDITILQERVQREHPSHTSEVLSVNQFRRPRQVK
jgi:hypothetical protein